MNDPKRWLDNGGGATFQERELLDAGRRAALPSMLRRRVWLGVATGAAGLGAASEAAGAMGAAAGKGIFAALVGSAAVKGAIAVAVVGGAGLGVARYRSTYKPAPVAATARAAPLLEAPPADMQPARPSKESAATTTRDEVVSSTRGGPAMVRAPATKPFAAPPRATDARPPSAALSPNDEAGPREAPAESRVASRLGEESAAVLAVRKTLLAGDAVAALRMLDRTRAAFPNGALAEEREALAVRALVASGQNDLARKRGEAFLRVFPKSPHASEVRAVLGP